MKLLNYATFSSLKSSDISRFLGTVGTLSYSHLTTATINRLNLTLEMLEEKLECSLWYNSSRESWDS